MFIEPVQNTNPILEVPGPFFAGTWLTHLAARQRRPVV